MTYESQMIIIYATKLTVACSMMENGTPEDMPELFRKEAAEVYKALNKLRWEVWGIVDDMEGRT